MPLAPSFNIAASPTGHSQFFFSLGEYFFRENISMRARTKINNRNCVLIEFSSL